MHMTNNFTTLDKYITLLAKKICNIIRQRYTVNSVESVGQNTLQQTQTNTTKKK